MRAIEQWNALKLMATERRIDVDDSSMWSIRIGTKRYTHHIYASCALLSAFEKVGTFVPPELRARPSDLD